MSASNFLALDQALQTTGWACYKDDRLVGYGTYQIPANKGIEARLGQMFAELNTLYQKYEFDHLVFEGIQNQQNAETFKKLAYVQAAIMLWCYCLQANGAVSCRSHLARSVKSKKRRQWNL